MEENNSMEAKTKSKKTANQGDWKNLIHGFVGSMLEQASDNIMQKIHEWIKNLKRKTLAMILSILGILYLLIGLSILFNAILGRIIPGFGYVTVGVLALLVAYLIGNDSKK